MFQVQRQAPCYLPVRINAAVCSYWQADRNERISERRFSGNVKYVNYLSFQRSPPIKHGQA